MVSKLTGDSEEVVLRNYINMDDDEVKNILMTTLNDKTEDKIEKVFEENIKEIQEKAKVIKYFIGKQNKVSVEFIDIKKNEQTENP